MATVTIGKTDSRLKAVKFLTSCMAQKDNRFHIKHFKVEKDGSAVATDGSRLHWVSELPIEPGYYQVHKNNKASVLIEKVYDLDTDEGSYPDCTDLLEVPNGNGEKSFNLVCIDNDPSSAYTQVIRTMQETTLNFNFVNDICVSIDDVVNCIVPESDTGWGSDGNKEVTSKPVHFVLNGFHAVIMPKRV